VSRCLSRPLNLSLSFLLVFSLSVSFFSPPSCAVSPPHSTSLISLPLCFLCTLALIPSVFSRFCRALSLFFLSLKLSHSLPLGRGRGRGRGKERGRCRTREREGQGEGEGEGESEGEGEGEEEGEGEGEREERGRGRSLPVRTWCACTTCVRARTLTPSGARKTGSE